MYALLKTLNNLYFLQFVFLLSWNFFAFRSLYSGFLFRIYLGTVHKSHALSRDIDLEKIFVNHPSPHGVALKVNFQIFWPPTWFERPLTFWKRFPKNSQYKCWISGNHIHQFWYDSLYLKCINNTRFEVSKIPWKPRVAKS